MNIVTELTSLRNAAQLTQAQLADNAGVNRLTVQRMEAGADPRVSTVLALARALGMDVMLVPRTLRPELENFIRSGGRFLGQPAGVDAPPSVVDLLANKSGMSAQSPSLAQKALKALLPAVASTSAQNKEFLARSSDPAKPDAP